MKFYVTENEGPDAPYIEIENYITRYHYSLLQQVIDNKIQPFDEMDVSMLEAAFLVRGVRGDWSVLDCEDLKEMPFPTARKSYKKGMVVEFFEGRLDAILAVPYRRGNDLAAILAKKLGVTEEEKKPSETLSAGSTPTPTHSTAQSAQMNSA